MKKLLSIVVAGALAGTVAPLALAADQAGNSGGVIDKTKNAIKRGVNKAKDFHERNTASGTVTPQAGERPTYPRTANTRIENNSASSRADGMGASGSASAAAGTGAGAMSGMSGRADAGTMSRDDRYSADRERTRERAMRWAQERNR